jgi:hypothetical protein
LIRLNKDRSPTYFKEYNLTTVQIAELINSINLIVNNFRKDYYNRNNKKDYDKISSTDIFNTWMFYNPQWNSMNFNFFVDVFDYIDTIKDERGVFLS